MIEHGDKDECHAEECLWVLSSPQAQWCWEEPVLRAGREEMTLQTWHGWGCVAEGTLTLIGPGPHSIAWEAPPCQTKTFHYAL